MMYVQKLSNHMALIIPRMYPFYPHACSHTENEDPPEKRVKDQELIEISLPEKANILCTRPPLLNWADAELCGKWKVLEKLLEHWDRQGSKVLIFSYSVRLLKMLEHLMMQKKYSQSLLDGKMSLEERSLLLKSH
jgi:DNA excision repair protein ERCC-6-like 2